VLFKIMPGDSGFSLSGDPCRVILPALNNYYG
jgi:hypothetical protein